MVHNVKNNDSQCSQVHNYAVSQATGDRIATMVWHYDWLCCSIVIYRWVVWPAPHLRPVSRGTQSDCYHHRRLWPTGTRDTHLQQNPTVWGGMLCHQRLCHWVHQHPTDRGSELLHRQRQFLWVLPAARHCGAGRENQHRAGKAHSHYYITRQCRTAEHRHCRFQCH